jgi:hypothetical protein
MQTETMTTATTESPTADPFRFRPPTAVDCPDWCDLPAGHAYDSEDADDGASARYHVVRFEETEAVTVEARGVWREGAETLGVPHICMWIDGKADDVITDADSARRHAAALQEAANVLEVLQRGTGA